MKKIFGREPAMILAFISSAIMMVAHFIYPLTIDMQGGLNAVAMATVGLVTMMSVAEDGGLALWVGLAKALIAGFVAFGLHWAVETQALVMSFVTITFQAFIIRPNVVALVTSTGTTNPVKELKP